MRRNYLRISAVCAALVAYFIVSPASFADAYREVGVWWVNNFSGTINDLDNCDECAEGLYDKLDDEGWTTRYNYGNSSAREIHWDGSKHDHYVDNCDIVMICTHGSSDYDDGWGKTLTSVVFSDGSTDTDMNPSEAYLLWGDDDLEWAALNCCSVLRNSTRKYWYRTMDHLHLLCGFTTTAYVNWWGTSQGKRWGKYMIDDGCCDTAEDVTQAWFHATDYCQPHGVTARVIAEHENNYDDYLWGQGSTSSDYSHDGHYWYWDHDAACKPPLHVSGLDAMTLFRVVDDPMDDNKAKELAQRLGFQDEVAIGPDGKYGSVAGTRKLEIDRNGGYYFLDLAKLWVLPDEAPSLPLEQEAIAAAEGFLEAADLLPDDAGDAEVGTEKVVEMDDTNEDGEEETLQEIDVMRWVYYPRVIFDGGDTFSVVGPGAKTKTYIGDGGAVLGAMGGWRTVEPFMQMNIFPEAEATRLLGQHGRKICLLGAPLYDTFEPEYTTLCYFEHQTDVNQMFLVPIYMMMGKFYLNGEISHEGSLYVPAAYEFLPPVPTITSLEDGATCSPGDRLNLSADVQFGYGQIAFEWWSDVDGFLGTGPTISARLTVKQHGSELLTNTVKVIATDQKGDRGVAFVTVNVAGDRLDPWVNIWLGEQQDRESEPYVKSGGEDTAHVVLMLSAGNPGPQIGVELYLCLIGPGRSMFFFPDWAPLMAPIPFILPENFEIGPIPFVRAELPSIRPPISQVGDYCFLAWLADHNTHRIIGHVGRASFNLDQ